MKKIFFLCFVLCIKISHAQITWDTIQKPDRHFQGQGTFKPSVKLAVIYNGNIGFEIGRVKNTLLLLGITRNTFTKYYGIQWLANNNYKNGLWSVKYGYDFDFRYLHLGLNLQAQSDLNSLKYFVSPSIGFSHWGTVGIYFISFIKLTKNNYVGDKNNQIGLKYNFTKNLKKEFKNGVAF